jgi:acyl-CoA dehydrogenase
MLSFTPSDEQKMLVDAIAKFAQGDVRSAAHDADEDNHFTPEILKKGWELGLLPAGIPEAYGGFGDYSVVTNVLAVEELANGDSALAMALMTPALVALPILLSGTEEQKQRYLPAISEADAPAYTAAMLEPGIRFNPRHPATTAKAEGGNIVLNGEKCYVPMAKDARVMLVYARDTESGCVDGYLVEGGTAGVTVGEREKLMGFRALPTYRVSFNNVTLSSSAKLGDAEGTRFERVLSHCQVGASAMAVGVGRAALNYAINYAKERVQFGVPIATKQAVAFSLAEMAIEVDAARLLVWEAAWKLDFNPTDSATKEAYLAKAYADKMVMAVTDGAVQALGGHGYIREHPVERWLRNGRGFAAFEGLTIA